MEFSGANPIVRLCLQGMDKEEKGQPDEACELFLRGWGEATNDLEKFLTAHYIARHQKTVADKLSWLETALEHALKINDDSVKSAFPSLYSKIAECYAELAAMFRNKPSDKGPFYHGTKADLQVGDLLTPRGHSNYQSDLKMNHIYFTALVNGAGLAAELAKGTAEPRVYVVEPTGDHENDPNVTDKKFPGNPTRSYRSLDPLKIVGERTDWARLTPEELKNWRDRLANIKGEIIN